MKLSLGIFVAVAAAVGAVGALVPAAHADSGPSGASSAMGSVPDHIDAAEQVDGIRVAARPVAPRATVRYFYVVADDDEAAAVRAGHPVDTTARKSDVCFASNVHSTEQPTLALYEAVTPPPSASASVRRPPVPAPRGSASARRPPVPPGPPPRPTHVYPVHMERLALADGKATIEAVDTWVDLDTGGARLVRRNDTDYALAQHGPNGFDLYSLQDGGATKFLAIAPTVDVGNGQKSRVAFAQLDGGELRRTSACGRIDVTLSAAESGGQMANVFTVVQVPPGPPSDDTRSADGSDSDDGSDDASADAPRVSFRAVRANLSVSRVSSDTQPLVSVSFAWVGPRQQMAVSPPAPRGGGGIPSFIE